MDEVEASEASSGRAAGESGLTSGATLDSITPTPGARNYGYPDDFMMYAFKVELCTRQDKHPRGSCPYAHPGDVARRRHPRRYQALLCPEVRAKKVCPRLEGCQCSHSAFEFWLHPDRYRTSMCEKGVRCSRPVCFFAHTPEELRPLPAGLRPAAPDDSSNKRTGSSVSSTSASQGLQQQEAAQPAGMVALAPLQYLVPQTGQIQYMQQPGSSTPGSMPAVSAGYGAPAAYMPVMAGPPSGAGLPLPYCPAPGGHFPSHEPQGSMMLVMPGTAQQGYVLPHGRPGMQQAFVRPSPPQHHLGNAVPARHVQEPPAQLPDMLHQFQQLNVSSGGDYAAEASHAGGRWSPGAAAVAPAAPSSQPGQVVPVAPPPQPQQQVVVVVPNSSGPELQGGMYMQPQVVFMPVSQGEAQGQWGRIQQAVQLQPYQQHQQQAFQQHSIAGSYQAAPYDMAAVTSHSGVAGPTHAGGVPVAAASVVSLGASVASSAGQLLQPPASPASLMLAGAAPLPALVQAPHVQPRLPAEGASAASTGGAGMGIRAGAGPVSAAAPGTGSAGNLAGAHGSQVQ